MQLQISCARGEDSYPKNPHEKHDVIDVESDNRAESSKTADVQAEKKRIKREKTKMPWTNSIDAFLLALKLLGNLMFLPSQHLRKSNQLGSRKVHPSILVLHRR